jgi:large repetitive protein
VTVPANSTRTFYAKATGSIGVSTCSSGITYSNIPAPDTSLNARVRKRKHKATFTFGSSDPSATFMCKLDKRALAPCTSPVTFKKLRKGRHTFTVEAVNAAGADPSPATFSFKLKR